MQRLRIGIVGLGGAGRAHARRFAQDPRAEVVGFFDPKPKHLEEAQQELRLDSVKILEQDWPAFLGKCRADIMALCSPDHVHVEHALDSLNAGCHVLCEKPMATTVEDAVSMAETAQRVGRKLMIHHQMRYLPVFLAAKKKISTGGLGKVFGIEADYYHDMRERATRFDNWRVQQTTVQNIVFGGACHPLDMMQWLAGDKIAEVFAYSSHQAFPTYPDVDTVFSVLKFQSGIVGRMNMSIGSCRPIFHPLTVLGTEGTLVDGLLLKTSKRSQVVYYPDKALSPRQRILGRWAMMDGRAIRFPYDHNEHDRACKDLIRDFLDAVLNDTSVPISVEDSIDVIRVCESLVMSYQTGLPVKVERRDESPRSVVKFAGVGAGHWAG